MTNEPIGIDHGSMATMDDLSAPTILVDAFSGIVGVNGVLVIGCTQAVLRVHSDTKMEPQKKVVLRLALPVGSLRSMARLLQDQVAQLERDGVIPPESTQD
jgi:hypothetical protein